MRRQCVVANLDRKEYLLPERFGEQAELPLIQGEERGIEDGITTLLAASESGRDSSEGFGSEQWHPIIGRWAGERIALIRSAPDTEAMPAGPYALPADAFERLLDQQDGWVDISEYAISAMRRGHIGEEVEARVRQVYAAQGKPFPPSRSVLHPDGSITPRRGGERDDVRKALIVFRQERPLERYATTIGRLLRVSFREIGEPWERLYVTDVPPVHMALGTVSYWELWTSVVPEDRFYALAFYPHPTATWEQWAAWLEANVAATFDRLKALGISLTLVFNDDNEVQRYTAELPSQTPVGELETQG